MIIILARIRSRLHYIIPKKSWYIFVYGKKTIKDRILVGCIHPHPCSVTTICKANHVLKAKQDDPTLREGCCKPDRQFGLLWIHEVRLSCDRLAAYRHASASNFCFSFLRDANKSSINAVKQNQVPQSIIICASIPLGC